MSLVRVRQRDNEAGPWPGLFRVSQSPPSCQLGAENVAGGGGSHSGSKMVEAPCGVKALFATGTCKDE